MLYCWPDLNRNPSTTSFASLYRRADLIINLDPQAFSRRLPWHPQGRQPQQTPRPAPCPPPPPSSRLACEIQLSDNPWTRPDAASPLLTLPSSSAEPQAE